MKRLFVDTSAWFAYVNRHDQGNRATGELFNEYEGRLVTSNYIFDEIVTLCAVRLGHSVAEKVGKTLLDPSVVDLDFITPSDQRDAWLLFLKRKDKAYSFTDCTSFVLMRRLELKEAAAFDSDFQEEGFTCLPS